MSSYYPNFSYLNKNSNEFDWMVVAFDPESGEQDSGLSQEQVYVDSYRGTKRILYGTRYTSTPVIKIGVVKKDRSDFTVEEYRAANRWLTGNPKATWLDLCVGDVPKYSFICTVQDVKPQKMDSRTVGLNIYFESVSPWGYSPVQQVSCSSNQYMDIDSNGVLYNAENPSRFTVDMGVLSNGGASFSMDDNDVLYISNENVIEINNQSDDLYIPIYLNTVFYNVDSDYLKIYNSTLNEETHITGIAQNETITLNENLFILSDKKDGKVFGDTFNFVWPRLAPGVNRFEIERGNGSVTFEYRYPIKIGNCAIDIDDLTGECQNITD